VEKDYLSTAAYLFLARLNDLDVFTRETGVGGSGGQYVGRTETKRKAYRLTLRYVKRTQQNPYGLVVSSVEQNEGPGGSLNSTV
jgi:hypothetical protein